MKLSLRRSTNNHADTHHMCPWCHGYRVSIGHVDLVNLWTTLSCRDCSSAWRRPGVIDLA